MIRGLFVSILIGIMAPLGASAAGKFDVTFGYFNLQAKTKTATGNLSGPGAYQLQYRTEVLPRIELALGYSLVVSKIYTGDMGFGPDVGAYYFPFTEASPFRFESPDIAVMSAELWRPYVGVAFNQRQYQSTQSTYAGFSSTFGTEYSWSKDFSLKGEVRMIQMTGPTDATATEMDVMFGLSVPF